MIPITHVPVTTVAKGIFRVGPLETGHTSGPTSPYIIKGKERALVAEPGQDGQVPGIMEALEKCDIAPEQVEYVWASHIHLYHIQGLSVLLPHLPKAKFLVHPRGAPHLVEPTRLMASTKEVWPVESGPAERGTKCYGPYLAIPQERLQMVEDNQIIDLGGKQLQIIYAPGHAPHHMGLFDLETRALFPGDVGMVPGPGRVRAHHDIRPPLFDVDKFVATLRHYRELKPSMTLTFGDRGGAVFEVEDNLRWTEEDILAIERVCKDGMKRKMSFKDIVARVEEYATAVDSQPRGRARGAEFTSGGIAGMLAHINRKDPSFELPKDLSRKMRGE